MCSGYLPKPVLCPHPNELRVHLKGKINWNFLRIEPRFPHKQKSSKIWKRPRIVNPEIMKRGGHKEENLLQEFQVWFCCQHWTDHFLSYFVYKLILHPLETVVAVPSSNSDFPGISPGGIWTFWAAWDSRYFTFLSWKWLLVFEFLVFCVWTNKRFLTIPYSWYLLVMTL